MSNTFEILNAINVNDHKEAKNGFDYLSWPWAWAEVKKIDPKANYRVLEDENGLPYFVSKIGAFVKVGVTISDVEHIEVFPVLDHRNKTILPEALNAFAINTSIKRAMVKAIAMHGLGLYIYAGEDLPESEESSATPEKKVTKSYQGKTPNYKRF